MYALDKNENRIEEKDNQGRIWYKLEFPDGTKGYIASWYMQDINEGLEVTYGSGTKMVFQKDEDKSNHRKWVYHAPHGVHDYVFRKNNLFQIIKQDQTRYVYDDNTGYLSYMIDKHGNQIDIRRDSQNRIISMANEGLKFEYNSIGNISKITDRSGRYVEYGYDSRNNLVSVKDLNGNEVRYTYYNDDFSKNRMKEIIDQNQNQILKNEYDRYGRLTKQYKNGFVTYQMYKDIYKDINDRAIYGHRELIRYHIDENGYERKVKFNPVTLKPILERNAYGHETKHRYYLDLNRDGSTNYKDGEEITDLKEGTDQHEKYLREVAKGAMVSKHTVQYSDSQNKWGYEYDKNNNLIKIIDPYKNTEEFEYNSKNQKTKKIDKEGNITKYEYYDDGVTLKSLKDPIGNITRYEYHQVGTSSGYSINTKGLVKREIQDRVDENGKLIRNFKITEYEYDNGYNYRTHVKDTFGNVTKKQYDSAGRLVKLTDANGNTTEYRYCNMDWLLSEKDSYNKSRIIRYDKVGNKTHVTDKRGQTTQYVYDRANRLQKIINPDGNKTEYKYDGLGNTVQEKDERGNITTYRYDALGRKVLETDAKGNSIKYEYDKRGNIIKVTDPEGIETLYTYDLLNRKTTKTQKYYHIPNLDTMEFEETERKKEYKYDNVGNITSSTNLSDSGVDTRFEYDKLGRVIKRIEGYGRMENGNSIQKEFEYQYDIISDEKLEAIIQINPMGYTVKEYKNALGQLVKTVNEEGETTSYKYDKVGNLIQETDARGNTTEYEYDNLNRKEKTVEFLNGQRIETIKTYDNEGNKTSVKDANNNTTHIRYDALGRIIQVIDPKGNSVKYEYDPVGNKIKVTDEENNVIEYIYNEINQKVAIYNPQKDIYKRFQYTWRGDLTKETLWGSDEFTAEYYYDELYREMAQINHEDIATLTLLDERDNLRLVSDGLGNSINYDYDVFGRLKEEIHPGDSTIPEYRISYTYDSMDNLLTQEDTLGKVDIYEYDKTGRLKEHITQNKDGKDKIKISFEYDENSNVIKETDANETETKYFYDELNRLITEEINIGDEIRQTNYEYDNVGNLIKATDWRGNTTTKKYDALDRLEEKFDAYGKRIEKLEYYKNSLQKKSIDAYENATEFKYDSDRNLVQTIDPEGNRKIKRYDAQGNIAQKVDGRGNVTRFVYDNIGRLKEVINAKNESTRFSYDDSNNMISQTDANKNTTYFDYNVRNQLIKRVDPGGREQNIDIDSKAVSIRYYADGSIKSSTDRNGNITNYEYDIHGRKTLKAVEDKEISYTYDNNGNQLTIKDETGTTTRTYDELNRVTSKDVPEIGKTIYHYDITTNLNDGEVAEQSKDPKGNITTKVYDRVKRLKNVIADGNVTTYSYYDNGARRSIRYPDGTTQNYTYYDNNLLKELTNKRSDQSVLKRYRYGYDQANNQIHKTDRNGTTQYTYDELNRLESVTEPDGKKTTYEFDRAGNRKKAITEEEIITYKYNEQNRLEKTITQDNMGYQTVDFRYDNNGNQLSAFRNIGENTTKLYENRYDEFNQLIKTNVNGQVVENIYNGEGLRVEKKVNGDITRYLYEYSNTVLEVDEKGNEKARNVYGNKLLSRKTVDDKFYYLYNGYGDVTGLIGTEGELKALYDYDPFGNPTEERGNADNPIRYKGYQYDKETGFYYLNARMYDPQTARFLQEDTYRGQIDDPLSLNLYTYCHNEPLMYDDPTGHFRSFISSAGNAVRRGARAVRNTANRAVQTTRNVVNRGVNYARQGWEYTKRVTRTAVDYAEKAVNTGQQMLSTGKQKLQNTASNAWNATTERVEQVSNYVAEKTSEVKEFASNMNFERINKGLSNITEGGIWTAVGIGAAITAICVLSGGTAIPALGMMVGLKAATAIVVSGAATTGVAGIVTAGFGVSQIIEGGDDINVGARNEKRNSFNPAKSLLGDSHDAVRGTSTMIALFGAGVMSPFASGRKTPFFILIKATFYCVFTIPNLFHSKIYNCMLASL